MEPELESASWLTPWAAEFRYDDAPIETLDRKRAITVANAAVSWCQEMIESWAEATSESDDSTTREPESE